MNAASEKPLSAIETTDTSHGLYEKLALAIAELKTRLQTRYERHFPGQTAMIRHALEEAESVAWCTPFPHLFLPDLAEARIAQFALTA